MSEDKYSEMFIEEKGTTVHTYNRSTQKAEAGDSKMEARPVYEMNFRPVWVHSKTLSQNSVAVLQQ